MRHLIACLLALTVAAGAARAQEDELLPVEQAFALSAKITEAGKVALHWEIAPDYYMYRSRIKAKSTQAGVTLGTLELPAGERKHDEFLGDVEVYHHAVDATLPYAIADAGAKTLTVTVTAQGCHETDPKICYPPHPTKLTLDLPANDAAAAVATSPAQATGLDAGAAAPLRSSSVPASSASLPAGAPLAGPGGSEPPLTEREAQIARLVACGLSDKEIAQNLGISFTTVRTHIKRAFDKLGVDNRVKLASRLHGAVLEPAETGRAR